MVWFCVTTQVNRERWAGDNITAMQHEIYLPVTERELLVGPRGKKKKVTSRVPLFPRYLFVQTTTGQWRFLTGCWGVSGIVMCGELPQTVPQHIIDQIRERETDGIIDLPPPPALFAKDDQVRITDGPLAGWVGLYQGQSGKDRENILLHLLGGKQSVSVLTRQLEHA